MVVNNKFKKRATGTVYNRRVKRRNTLNESIDELLGKKIHNTVRFDSW